MKEREFGRLCRLLIDELRPWMLAECKRLYKSGAIDPNDYGDNFELPKLVVSAVYLRASEQYAPLSPEGKREIRNLSHF